VLGSYPSSRKSTLGLHSHVPVFFCLTPLLCVVFVRPFSSQTAEDKKLWDAAYRGHEDVVRTCIANGADVDGHKDHVRKTIHLKVGFFHFISFRCERAHLKRCQMQREHRFLFSCVALSFSGLN